MYLNLKAIMTGIKNYNEDLGNKKKYAGKPYDPRLLNTSITREMRKLNKRSRETLFKNAKLSVVVYPSRQSVKINNN